MELNVTNFSAGYGTDKIVKNVSFSLPSGTLTALIGANGCGKTTLLKGLCHLIPHSGAAVLSEDTRDSSAQTKDKIRQNNAPSAKMAHCIDLDRCSSRALARYVSYISQRSGITISLSVLDVVLMGFQPFLPLLSSPGKSHEAIALSALQTVGLDGCADKDFLKLSEGQKQLCILARSLVQNTPLLLFDEPDSALDYPNRRKMLSTIRKIVYDKNKTGLLVLHDLGMALDYCHQLLLMQNGELIGTLYPKTDSEARLSEGFSRLYGPVEVFRRDGHCFIC